MEEEMLHLQGKLSLEVNRSGSGESSGYVSILKREKRRFLEFFQTQPPQKLFSRNFVPSMEAHKEGKICTVRDIGKSKTGDDEDESKPGPDLLFLVGFPSKEDSKYFVSRFQTVVSSLEMVERKFSVTEESKDCALVYLLRQLKGRKVMVFVRTPAQCCLLQSMLSNLELEAIMLHGSIHQRKANHTLKNFASGTCDIIISTTLTTERYEIPIVDIVINYCLPANEKDYLVRIGRTGGSGLVISMVAGNEEEGKFAKIENIRGKKFGSQQVEIEGFESLKEEVKEAMKGAKRKCTEEDKKRKRAKKEAEKKHSD